MVGYDDLRSTDHFCGPRLQIVVEDRGVGAADGALRDCHAAAMQWETVNGQLRLDRSYFERSRPHRTRGWTHFAAPADAQALKYKFTWTLAEIVTALAVAGLSISRMSEYPTDATWKFGDALDAAQALPGHVLLEARRP